MTRQPGWMKLRRPIRSCSMTVAALLAFGSIACNGVPDGSVGATGATGQGQGIALPSEVSAVSTTGEAGGSNQPLSIWSELEPGQNRPSAIANLPAGSDYHTVQVRKFVEIRALGMFSILSSIFDAIRQTHYVDHVGGGWYKTMVAFEDDGGNGGNQTRLEEWYVDSSMITGQSGALENRVQVKIVEPGELGSRLIRAQIDIRTAPTALADGSIADMGAWTIRAAFGLVDGADSGESFMAEATLLGGGISQVTIQETFVEDPDGPGPLGEMNLGSRGLIVRSPTAGQGVVEFIDQDFCWQPGSDCSVSGPPLREVIFAYDENYLTIQRDGESAVSFDRHDDHELVHRYGLFDGVTGDQVEKSRLFGFPVRTAEGRHGWYGAWQGRHELWIDGGPAASGIEVTRENTPSGQTPVTYTTVRFDGALTKVNLVPGRIEQVLGVPAETNVSTEGRLRWNVTGQRWEECLGVDAFGTCAFRNDFTSRLPSLALGAQDRRRIHINGCIATNPQNPSCRDYVYLDTAPGPGFSESVFDPQTGRHEPNGTMLDPAQIPDDSELRMSIGGQIYVEYTGEFSGPTTSSGWVQKRLTSFDTRTWTPTFDPAGDTFFQFDVGREYVINKRSANLRVSRIAATGTASDYAVFMENYGVASPAPNLPLMYSPGTLLVNGWDPVGSSLYRLDVDPASLTHLLLVFQQVSPADALNGYLAGDVVDVDIWGLRIQGDNSPASTATTYNWSYQSPGENWGGVTYLTTLEGDQPGHQILDEALRFEPVALPSRDDVVQQRPQEEWLNYSLSYDGWLHGVPDAWNELNRIGFDPARIPAVLGGNVRVEDGTVLVEEGSGREYAVKALDVGIFLGVADAMPLGAPDLGLAYGIDLDTGLPVYAQPDMTSSLPTGTTLLYVEGIPTN